MNHRSNRARAERILDRLDAIVEAATFSPGADAPERVAAVDRYHDAAGWCERRVVAFADEVPSGDVARHLAHVADLAFAATGRA